ncbi:hypothetical protein JCM3765_000698 [Sporobolomyces pararoseus]
MYKPPEGTYLSLPTRPSFYTWLTIDGIVQPLYNLKVTPEKTECYVESRAGALFAVHFGVDGTATKRKAKGFQAAVSIDGQWQRGKNLTADALPGVWSLAARRDSESTERPFIFGEISTTSIDDLASTSEVAAKALGSIELRYRRIKKIKPRESAIKGEFDSPAIPIFHEDSKAAMLAHQGRRVQVSFSVERCISTDVIESSRLGPSQIAQFREERQNKYVYHETKENPFHTFTFLYRSRSFLESHNLLQPLSLASTITVLPAASNSFSRVQNTVNSTPSTSRQVDRRTTDSPATSTSTSRSRSRSRTAGRGGAHERRYSGTAETEIDNSLIRGQGGERGMNSLEDDQEFVGMDAAEELRKLEDELEKLRQIEMEVRSKKRISDTLDTDGNEVDSHGRKRARSSVVEKEVEVLFVD